MMEYPNYSDSPQYAQRYPSHGSSSQSVPGHTHDSSGEHTPPGALVTPGLEYPTLARPSMSGFPHTFIPSSDYGLALGSSHFPGSIPALSADAFDLDGMKRALETTGLPNNPISGNAPQINLASSFYPSPAKRPRQGSIALSQTSPGYTTRPELSYQSSPGFSTMSPNGPTMGVPPSPVHLGASLSGPHAPPLSQGQNSSPYVPMSMGMNVNLPVGYANGLQSYMQYPISPVVSPSMNPNTMTGNYGPAAAAAAAAAASNVSGRTVYVGGLPSEASVDELLNLVRFGPIENIRILPEKSCVFISFLDGSTAAAFFADASVKKLALKGSELKIGWGKPSYVAPHVAQAVVQNQATRNVFIGSLDDNTNEEDLRDVCVQFGPIDQVKIVRDKNIGFVHFLSISTAMKVVAELPTLPGWTDKRVNYGKDRCAYVPKAQQAAVQAAQAQAAAAMASHVAQLPPSAFPGFSPITPTFGAFGNPQAGGFASPLFPVGMQADGNQIGNRTVYLGNIHPETTTEELCNNIRGGAIAMIRHMKDKNIAFVTFVDAHSAMQFVTNANLMGLTINHRRLKIGWGKPSGPLSPIQLQAVQSGATRNVYIGQIEDMSTVSEEKLRIDFAEYGDIEMINFLNERKAAFVNFTSIAAAVKAVEGMRVHPEYSKYRIAYGKDRCANAPRPNQLDRATMMAPPRGHQHVNGQPISRPNGSVSPTDLPKSEEAVKEEKSE